MIYNSLRSGDNLGACLEQIFKESGGPVGSKGMIDDHTIQLQGGLTWSAYSHPLGFSSIDGIPTLWNGYKVYITTHPDELATPAILELYFDIFSASSGDSGELILSNLIVYSDFLSLNTAFNFLASIDNTLLFSSMSALTSFSNYKSINNNTLVITAALDTEQISAQQCTNNLVVTYWANLYTLNFSGTTLKNNTVYNYSGAGQASSGGTGTLLGNPNLETPAYLQSASDFTYDNISTMLTRSAKLTTNSYNCVGLADIATATAIDLNGKSRS